LIAPGKNACPPYSHIIYVKPQEASAPR
jgi:hypothetical protein